MATAVMQRYEPPYRVYYGVTWAGAKQHTRRSNATSFLNLRRAIWASFKGLSTGLFRGACRRVCIYMGLLIRGYEEYIINI